MVIVYIIILCFYNILYSQSEKAIDRKKYGNLSWRVINQIYFPHITVKI